ncbi:hypothetical protein SAMN04488144_1387 [Methylobacterium sp. 190mf]|nr:hypothetical protein SAMN04488144_1387 [Methylobacterium sp. 190mf]
MPSLLSSSHFHRDVCWCGPFEPQRRRVHTGYPLKPETYTQGLSPERVQTLMGHASIHQTFDQYGYLFEAQEDEAAMLSGV